MIAGGWGQTEVTKDHQDLIDEITPKLNELLNANNTYKVFEVLQQLVAGMNYEFILHTNDGRTVKTKVYTSLPYSNVPPQIISVTYL